MSGHADYNILIVGAGIAGLHCAMRLSEGSTNTIAIAEAYDYVGGRCFTYRNPSLNLQWEAGAGRIKPFHFTASPIAAPPSLLRRVEKVQ